MSEFISGYGTKLELDIGTEGTPNWVDISGITTSASDTLNATLDTFHTLASQISNTVKTGVDPEWALTSKGDKSNEALKFLLGKKYATGADAVVKFKLTDALEGVVVQANATLTNISTTMATATAIEVAWAMKPYDGAITVTPAS